MSSPKKNLSLSDNPAHQAYLRGDYARAIELQMAEVNQLIKKGEKPVTERKLLGLYFYSAGEYGAAIEMLKVIEDLAPEDSEIPENIGIMMRQSGNLKAAIQYLLKAHEMAPEKSNVCDGLAHCFGNLQDDENTQKFGRLSLKLKDAAAAKSPHGWEIPTEKPAPFSYDDKAANIISFSLWGDNPRYLRGAIRNAQLAPDLYPGWTCRFYIDDSVPCHTVTELENLGCEIVTMPAPDPFYEGLLWRFQVIGDPKVKRFLVRDCDSVINIKERVAVDEWLASDRWFHMMRDFISHTEMVLAGMWGGVNGVLPSLSELRKKFKTNTAPTRTYDQHLLRDMVWPTMRQSVLLHDSVYTGELGSVPFPAVGELGPRQHVGQNEAAIAEFCDVAEKRTARMSGRQPFFVFGMENAGSAKLQQILDAHPHANCRPGGNTAVEFEESLSSQVENTPGVEAERMHELLYTTWLSEWLQGGLENSTTHVGLQIDSISTPESLRKHAELFPDAKFLYVVRDPRKLVAASGSNETNIAEKITREWVSNLESVSKFASSHRGRIEMVRLEDIESSVRCPILTRKSLKFLGLNSGDRVLEETLGDFNASDRLRGEESTSTEVSRKQKLSEEQIDIVEEIAGEMMKKLRYRLSEKPVSRTRNLVPATRVKVAGKDDVALPA